MGERLAGGNVAVALLANTLATGAALVALILTFGPISGAHFNPAVTLADASQGGLPWRDVPGYVAAQIVGAFAGVAAAHVDVRAAAVLRLAARPRGARADVQRVRGHVRPARGDLGLRARARRPPCPSRWPPTSRRPTGSRPPRRSPIPAVTLARVGHRHVRGHPAGRRPRLHRRAAPRRGGGDRAVPLAGATAARVRRCGRGLLRAPMTPRHVLFLCIWGFADPSQATGSEEERLQVFQSGPRRDSPAHPRLAE